MGSALPAGWELNGHRGVRNFQDTFVHRFAFGKLVFHRFPPALGERLGFLPSHNISRVSTFSPKGLSVSISSALDSPPKPEAEPLWMGGGG